MNNINWDEIALQYEIEYSKALGGTLIYYENFIHIYNPLVPYGGDYNRAVGIKLTDYKSFEEIEEKVKIIHKDKNLDVPARFDIYPPKLNENIWKDYLNKKGFSISTPVYFRSKIIENRPLSELQLYLPSEDEYVKWYHNQVKCESYYDDEWFHKILPIRISFIKIFKPYWLMLNNEIIGWIYCQYFGNWCNIFELEIIQELRRKGFGRKLLKTIKYEAGCNNAKYLILQTSERNRNFYYKCGFELFSENSVIRLKLELKL